MVLKPKTSTALKANLVACAFTEVSCPSLVLRPAIVAEGSSKSKRQKSSLFGQVEDEESMASRPSEITVGTFNNA